MATKTKSPIVPFLISGTYKIYEANGGWIKPAHVTVTVLPAIHTQQMDRSRINQLTEEVCDILLQEQKRQKETRERSADNK